MDGEWKHSSGALCTVSSGVLTWPNGQTVAIIESAGKYHIYDQGQKHTGSLVNGRVEWDDGDVWSRPEPSSPTMSSRRAPVRVMEVEKIVKIPEVHYVDRIVGVPEVQCVERVVEVPVEIEKEIIKEVKHVETVVVEKIVDVPQVQYVEKIVEVPVPDITFQEQLVQVPKVETVVVDRVVKVPEVLEVEKLIEIPVPGGISEKIVEVPVTVFEEKVVETPVLQTEVVEKFVDAPQLTYIEKIVEVPNAVTEERIVSVPVVETQTIEKIVEHPDAQAIKFDLTVWGLELAGRTLLLRSSLEASCAEAARVAAQFVEVSSLAEAADHVRMTTVISPPLGSVVAAWRRLCKAIEDGSFAADLLARLRAVPELASALLEFGDRGSIPLPVVVSFEKKFVDVPIPEIHYVEKLVPVQVEKGVVVREKLVQVPEISVVEREVLVDVPQVEYIDRTVEVPQYFYKDAEVPETRYEERIVEVPHVEVRPQTVYVPVKVPRVVEKIVEVPQITYVEKLVEVPEIVVVERITEVPVVTTKWIEKTVEVPQVTYVERVVEVPEIRYEERIVDAPRDEHIEVATPAPTDDHARSDEVATHVTTHDHAQSDVASVELHRVESDRDAPAAEPDDAGLPTSKGFDSRSQTVGSIQSLPGVISERQTLTAVEQETRETRRSSTAIIAAAYTAAAAKATEDQETRETRRMSSTAIIGAAYAAAAVKAACRGTWLVADTDETAVVADGWLIWSDGDKVPITYTSKGFYMEHEGELVSCSVDADQLKWDDGDIWRRAEDDA